MHRARVVLIILLAVAWAVGVQAAPNAVGVQLGGDWSGIDGDVPPNSEYARQFGLVAGAQAEIGLGDALHLSLQPSFVQRKSGVTIAPSSAAGTTRNLTLSFDYVSIPVILKFAMGGGRTYVAGGGTVDFMTAATLSEGGSGRNVKPAFNDTGFGAVLGFGVVFPVGRTRLTTELRFVQGLVNIAGGTASEASGALAPRLSSNGFQLVVGDLLPLGSR